MSNLFKKILSLALASVLWVFVNSSLSTVAVQDTVAIQYKSLNNNLILLNAPKQMNYHIQANPQYSKNLKANLTVQVDLTNIGPGWHTLPVTYTSDTSLPAYAKVKLASQTVRLLVDEKYFKHIDVKAAFDFTNKKSDYTVSQVNIEPSSIIIYGPRSLVDPINEISTEPILISNNGQFKKVQPLAFGHPNISSDTESVTVQYMVYFNKSTKTIALPIKVQNDSLDPSLKLADITPHQIELELQGTDSQLESVESAEAPILIDLSAIKKAGTYKKIPVILNLPKGINVVTPSNLLTVDVTIQTANEPESHQSSEPQETENTSVEKNEDPAPNPIPNPSVQNPPHQNNPSLFESLPQAPASNPPKEAETQNEPDTGE